MCNDNGLGVAQRWLTKDWLSIALRLSVSAVMVFFALSCGSKPTDPRTVIPGDALVYLETNDLGMMLKAITDNPKFEGAVNSKPNLDAVNGVKVSIAVTGFETSEQSVTEENAVLQFQPRFVAVVETNAWGWQATSFIENKLGEFVNEVYGGEIVMEVTPRNDGKSYVWTAPDGRKAYALQQGSLVFFGNDETAIERCQAVKRGEVESIVNNSKVAEGERLAFGYMSPQGVGQIANIAGISLAMGASEEEEVKSFVARVLPEILRNSVTELTWTAVKTEQGIEDRYDVAINPELAKIFNETIVPSGDRATDFSEFIPPDAVTATRYNLKDPQIAWRSVVLSGQNQTDQTSGALIAAFSGSLFEPYGIENPELFLSLAAQQLMTVRFDPEGDNVVVITQVKDPAKLPAALDEDIRSQEKNAVDYVALASGDFSIIGDPESALKCQQTKQGRNRFQHPFLQRFLSSDAVAVTAGTDSESSGKLFGVLAEPKAEGEKLPTYYVTETRFNRNGIERRTTSDFGFIGWLIEHLSTE